MNYTRSPGTTGEGINPVVLRLALISTPDAYLTRRYPRDAKVELTKLPSAPPDTPLASRRASN